MALPREAKRPIKNSENFAFQIYPEAIPPPPFNIVPLWVVLRPSKFEGHCPMIRHGCRMALMVALNWSVECVKEE
ncbi:MAG: hypothetical protein BECKG1743F_GA0114225_103765, partial [Candidatus Kentron sp. G]